ncbi:hypothetical protein K435DRAFT_798227 [Dendrothele bispora CBS 962.96]|uniref:Uncharacterized protein n=1 Tax=Dendrothele bispora (strain CBS 962.96) TaxID=1314807 RepID=A0A4S8M092_DENBC|nr:hypothetical protein K435DRAFT_798227 [Dendrothele bispora CBS 962.96]
MNANHPVARPKRHYTAGEQRIFINRLARTVLLQAFGANEFQDIHLQPPLSPDRSRLYQQDRRKHGPDVNDACLDTSGNTAHQIRDLPWNQSLIVKLAKKAREEVSLSEDPPRFGLEGDVIDWEALFSERIYRIATQVIDSRDTELLQASAYECKKKSSKRRKALQQICTTMIAICRDKNDMDGLLFWQEVLQCTDTLTIHGMSEEEDGNESGEPVKVVLDPPFRHADFRPLFRFVDDLPQIERKVFNNTGRKCTRRIEGGASTTGRTPIQNLPRAYYCPEYLEDARLGWVPEVSVAEGELVIPK